MSEDAKAILKRRDELIQKNQGKNKVKSGVTAGPNPNICLFAPLDGRYRCLSHK